MAGTPIEPIAISANKSPNRKMNSDVDPVEFRNGDYRKRVNVEFNNNGRTFADTPARGMRPVIEIAPQQLQQQRLRIYFDNISTGFTLRFFNANRQQIDFRTVSAVASLQGNKDAIVSMFQSLPRGSIFFNGTGSAPYIDVESQFFYSDWYIELTAQNGNAIRTAVIQEAISNTGTGQWHIHGKRDINGVLWITATTQRNEKIRVGALGNMQRFGSEILLYQPGHGLSNYDTVSISGATGAGSVANGNWVVEILPTGELVLKGANGLSMPDAPANYGGVWYKNAYGLGLIGVQEYNPNDDNYSFTTILKSKKLNFVTTKQVDIDGEVNNMGWLLKFTDFYNVPRTFSYNGDFLPNGAIQALNPKGQYDYSTVDVEIQNIQNISGVTITELPQIQTGGDIAAGHWRYTVQLLTESLSASPAALLSKPFPVFDPQYISGNIAGRVYGNPSTVTTGKVNQIQVDNITPGVYKYIELIAVQYSGDSSNAVAIDSKIVRREVLSSDQTSIVLEHNGNETETVPFDTAVASVPAVDIRLARHNRLIDNRLVYANLKTSANLDLTEFAKTLRYSIKIDRVYGSFGAETHFEFYDPANVTNSTSYQQYEWYRFYVVGRSKMTGTLTNAAFAFDVRFVTQADYNATEEFRFLDTNITDRRVMAGDEFLNYDLASSSGGGDFRFYNQYHLELKGSGPNQSIDWDYQIEGVPLRELFSEILVYRAERRDEVIATGNYHVARAATDNTNIAIEPQISNGPFSDNGKGAFGSLYFPDLLFGLRSYETQSNDKLLVFGCQLPAQIQTGNSGPPPPIGINSWFIYWGITNKTTPLSFNIQASSFVGTGLSNTILGQQYRKQILVGTGITGGINQGSHIIKTVGNVRDTGPSGDYGRYYCIIYRERKDKYGSITSQNDVFYTGYYVDSGESSSLIKGGDVFTQQTWIKHSNPQIRTDPVAKIGGYGYNIISQNRLNTNLRVWDNSSLLFPVSTKNFVTWLDSPLFDQTTKNAAYQIINNVQTLPIFDPNVQTPESEPTRKRWSQLRPTNSLKDETRDFLPDAFQDNPNTYGEITHLEVVEGELFTWQERNFTREFFNSTGRLHTIEDGNVLIGDGSVLSRNGLSLSMFGTQHKWGVQLGFSDAGKQIAFWPNAEFGTIMRFGADGTVNISERDQMSTFFQNAMRFVKGKDTPADNQGLHTIWDNRGKNFIITARGWKEVQQWQPGATYNTGSEVKFGQEQGIDQIWVAIQTSDGIAQPGTPAGNAYWKKIEYDDLDYYSVWTAVYSAEKACFTDFYTFYPRIYLSQSDRYFSPSPFDGESGTVYRHRDIKSRILSFYGRDNYGYTEDTINYANSINKKFNALAYTSLLKPYKVEMFSQFISERNGIQNRMTLLTRDEMEMREGKAFGQVKNDLDANGRNDGDTAPMDGNFMTVRTWFAPGEEQKINELKVIVRMGQRNAENP